MSFPRYQEYKDSGVEWLGEVPAHWDASRLRFICQCLDGQRIPLNAAQRSDKMGDIPYWGANSIVGYVDEALFDEDLVLLGEDGAPFFEPSKPVAFFSQGKVWPNNHVHVLRPTVRGTGTFITHVLNVTDYAQFIDGSTRDKLTQGSMNDIPIPWPPLAEQTQIAAFLDRETAKIDELVAEQRRLMELMKEKRQAVISHAVTKGLNPDAPMKPSGIGWLGEVPEHWGVAPLKAVTTYNDEVLDETTTPDTEIVYVDISSVDGVSGIKMKETMPFSAAPSRARRRVRDGDVIVSTVRTYLRAIARIRAPEENLIVSTGFAVIRPRSELMPDFLGCLVSASYFVDQVIARSTGVSYPAINASELVAISVPLPPPAEQTQIATFLDRENAKLDALTVEAQRAIDLLQERRTALISAAVTGQIDVRQLTEKQAA